MSYADLPPLPKSFASAIPGSSNLTYAAAPSSSSSACNLPKPDAIGGHNRYGSFSSTADSVSSGDGSKSPTVSSTGTTSNESNMDTQLATLRQEMHNLRQMDLSLLTQLWALNESIQGFRARLEDHNNICRSPSPEEENVFTNISTASLKDNSSISCGQNMRGTTPIKLSGDMLHNMTVPTKYFVEKTSCKSRSKKNLYEEDITTPDTKHQPKFCTQAFISNSNQPYAYKDVEHNPISNINSFHSTTGGVELHEQINHKAQTNVNITDFSAQLVPPTNAHSKTSKGAIPKILSILQRKQRTTPPSLIHKSPHRPV